MEEWNTSFSGNCSSKHGFTSARRPEEKKEYDQYIHSTAILI